MFIPKAFYGKFSDVEKKFRSIRSKKKSLEKIQHLYDELNQDVEEPSVHEGYVISLSDDYMSRKHTNAYFPSIFSIYLTFEEDKNGEIAQWFKKVSLESHWCQLSALVTNSPLQFWYADKEYSKRLGDSICSNWDVYMSLGEHFCFMPGFEKPGNKYFFWEHNIALAKLIISIKGRGSVSLTVDDLKDFPTLWQKYCC